MLRNTGIPAVSGDAPTPKVLIQAHIARASMLIITIPNTIHIHKMVETAKTLNPTISVVLRTHNEAEVELFNKEHWRGISGRT